LAVLALWWFTSEDPWVTVAGTRTEAVADAEQTLYAVRTVNIRSSDDIASAQLGIAQRGNELRGHMVKGKDGREWLQLSDGSGFVSRRNLSSVPPPVLDEAFDESLVYTANAPIHAQPDPAAEVIGRTSDVALRTVGQTGDWYEVLLDDGVGYVQIDQLFDFGWDLGEPDTSGAGAASNTGAAGSSHASGSDASCSYATDGSWVACGTNAATCAYSTNGRQVACGGLATTCAYSTAGNHVACGGRATTCAYSTDGSSVACGGMATTCAYSVNGNDVSCGGLANSCAYSVGGYDVACGGRANSCAASVKGNDVACGGDATSCSTSVDGNDVACGARASGCRTALNGRRACGDGLYTPD